MNRREDFEQAIGSDKEEYDVVVAGGGPAGLGAAVAAALSGAKTLVLEGRSFFGGVAQISHWMPINWLVVNGELRGGVHDMFVKKFRELGPNASTLGEILPECGINVHPDYLKLAAFEILEAVGVKYRLYSPVVEVECKSGVLKAVITNGKGGRKRFIAKAFVDATGDGDVAWLAGAPMDTEGGPNGYMPVTLSFTLYGDEAYKKDLSQFLNNAKSYYGYTVSDWYAIDKSTINGVFSINNGGRLNMGVVNGADSADLTLAERAGIQLAVDAVKLLRHSGNPGLAQMKLLHTGACVGVRETRRIIGEYVMTMEDAVKGTEFDDIIARRYGWVDPGGLDIGEHEQMVSGHAFPYRALLPQKVENLLVGGRCASATQTGQACGKSMGNMMELGQACGVAAALSAKTGIAPRNLDVKQIQKILIGMGVKLYRRPLNAKGEQE